MRTEYDFARHGERSIARGYTKAVPRARRLIYLEDQYLWSKEVARVCSLEPFSSTPGCI